jgi:hypothetical protein
MADGQQMRLALIEKVRELAAQGTYSLQQSQVLEQAAQALGIRFAARQAEQEALLAIWYDLFREGYLA